MRAYDWGTFGARLRQARERTGLSSEELAERAGYWNRSVQQWESGFCAPRLEGLVALCQVLDVDADWLLGRVGEEG